MPLPSSAALSEQLATMPPPSELQLDVPLDHVFFADSQPVGHLVDLQDEIVGLLLGQRSR